MQPHGINREDDYQSSFFDFFLIFVNFFIIIFIAEPAGKVRQRSSIAKEIW